MILQADKNGEIHTFYIRLSYDVFDTVNPDVDQPAEITLIYSLTRQHFHVALTCAEYQAMVNEENKVQKVFIDLSIEGDVSDEYEYFSNNIDNLYLSEEILSDDSDIL